MPSLWNVLSTIALSLSAQAGPTLLLEVPGDHATGIAVPVAARYVGTDRDLTHAVIDGLSEEKVFAQREQDSERVWIVAKLSSNHVGRTLPLAARGIVHAEPTMHAVQERDGVLLAEGKRSILFYQQTAKAFEGQFTRSAYVHPLYGLDGEVLTEDFPEDHRHHRGVFWAWHQILVGDTEAGDSWAAQDFLCRVRSVQTTDQGRVFASITATADWTSPHWVDGQGNPKPFATEHVRIRAFRATNQSRCVDFEIKIEALVADLRIGGAPNSKGYSGFTVRVKPPREMTIRAENHTLTEDRLGITSRWADVTGYFAGQSSVNGIAILGHRSLPQFPSQWLLRHYGMQNVIYPGRHTIEIQIGKPLILRHRLVIHRGALDAADVAKYQQAYETTAF